MKTTITLEDTPMAKSMSPNSAIQPVATKNIVRIDFVDFFATAIIRPLHENYHPPRPVRAA
jgi:hypothetical protein